jgi:isopentenyl-diphosphate delta-isomerase
MVLRTEDVIIVNEKDEWLGTMEKIKAHKEGVLHRALSIFVLNDKQELLLQQRAENKYHSGGLWSNTCCSHPAPGESTEAAAHRRLKEEMGFDCPLEQIFTFRYNSNVSDGLIENEIDHIYFGYYNDAIYVSQQEVSAYKFLSLEKIQEWIKAEPQLFTKWFHLAFSKFMEHLTAVA